MLPAMHAAGEALRNFTGLIDDADQRALFRQRDPGTDAVAGMQSRPPPAPNSAADAPTQVRVSPCPNNWLSSAAKSSPCEGLRALDNRPASCRIDCEQHLSHCMSSC